MREEGSNEGGLRGLLENTWARVLIGLVFAVAAGVLIGYAVFGDDGDSGRSPATAPATVPPATAAAAAGALVRFDQYGLTLRRPAGWTSGIKRGVLNVAAPDETVSLALAMPQGRPDARTLRGTDRV